MYTCMHPGLGWSRGLGGKEEEGKRMGVEKEIKTVTRMVGVSV